ncbi:MAG TPA: hypothetical protein VMI54_05070 [Polyangiaceae bacterium]|nr:hypothetical protein [Polyangiaceae bacterium]
MPSASPAGHEDDSTDSARREELEANARRCGGPEAQREMVHTLYEDKDFMGAFAEPASSEEALAPTLEFDEVSLGKEPTSVACAVAPADDFHLVTGVFEITGGHAAALLVYEGYAVDIDSKHVSNGRYDLVGITEYELGRAQGKKTSWLEERFVWNGKQYRFKGRKRVQSNER